MKLERQLKSIINREGERNILKVIMFSSDPHLNDQHFVERSTDFEPQFAN
jgi:hypothetical protein